MVVLLIFTADKWNKTENRDVIAYPQERKIKQALYRTKTINIQQ